MASRPGVNDSLQIAPAAPATAINSNVRWFVFIALHIPLVVLARAVPAISTAHALLTVAVGLLLATSTRPSVNRAALVGAYIAGAEVFWRMTHAGVFWEYGKYATCLIFIVALIHSRLTKLPFFALAYLLALVPGAMITLTTLGLPAAQEALSFSLSGPLALGIAAWFFSNVKMSSVDFKQFWLLLMAPVASIGFIVFSASFLGGPINWTNNSNIASSGGFGPNQVSAALGLAAFGAWLVLVYGKPDKLMKLAMIGGCLGFLTLGVLTFSRGGVYTALAAGLMIIPLELIRGRQKKGPLIVTVLGAAVLVVFVILPAIGSLTSNMVVNRFTNPSATGRDLLVQEDIQIFLNNPFLGVGVGLSPSVRQEMGGRFIAAHTEYSRLLAEHGTLGIVAMALLALMIWGNYRRNRLNPTGQNITISTALWALITMTVAATRMVAPSLMLGIGCTEFEMDSEENVAPSV